MSVEPPPPEPADCVPPDEPVRTQATLSNGWLAVTPRQVLVYRTDREPPLVTVLRANVTGIAVRRSGDGPVIRYAPRVAAYGVVGVLVGLLFGALVPAASVDLPQDSPAAGALGFVTALTGALQLLGDLAILSGAVALVGALGALGYRLASGGRALVVKVAGDTSVRCRAADGGGRQALQELEAALDGPVDPESRDARDVGRDAESGDAAGGEPNTGTDSGSEAVD